MKKIILSLPEELLEKVDDQLKYEEISRSEWIRRALILALEQAKKDRIRARMEKGYQEMDCTYSRYRSGSRSQVGRRPVLSR